MHLRSSSRNPVEAISPCKPTSHTQLALIDPSTCQFRDFRVCYPEDIAGPPKRKRRKTSWKTKKAGIYSKNGSYRQKGEERKKKREPASEVPEPMQGPDRTLTSVFTGGKWAPLFFLHFFSLSFRDEAGEKERRRRKDRMRDCIGHIGEDSFHKRCPQSHRCCLLMP